MQKKKMIAANHTNILGLMIVPIRNLMIVPIRNFLSPLRKYRNIRKSISKKFTTHQSPITNHQSPLTTHHSPITNHQSPYYVAID